ncbi:sensor histidine kinase [Alloscardovia criceti]|uniref:sensor histidine kinase n=1 Tax=Alloscardovia criceti TaxID=356828 RepID=UPI00036904DA|nr:ATP-binding protein [Alloscardovia criceti]
MELNVTSILSLIMIFVMIIIFLGWVLSWVWRWIAPLFGDNKDVVRKFKSFQWRQRYTRRRRLLRRISRGEDDSSSDDDDDEDEELDTTTLRVLSSIDAATIVVDSDDEVERASASTYRWGIVKNDEIVNEDILKAIREVREGSGRQNFDIVTYTASDIDEDDNGAPTGVKSSVPVARPHWLNVRINILNTHYILVIITDNSEAKRFAQTRDDFVKNVADRLMKATTQLDEIGLRWQKQSTVDAGLTDAKAISSQARSLNKLVSDLILLIQAQEKISPTEENRMDLGALVKDVTDNISPRRPIRLHTRFAEGVMVNANAAQIRAAVEKLVANAIYYSKDNGVVSVVVDTSRDHKYGVIRVIDTGVGIEPEEQSHIFERFYRGTNQPDNSDENVGLGLSIVKHVALTHHGNVTVWSAPGQGSTFTLFIPLAPQQ